MKNACLYFVVAVMAIGFSCKKTDTTDFSAVLEQQLTNVSYGSDPKQVMDIYLPANRSTSDTRMLAMIHGGGWNAGDKLDFASFMDTIKRRFPNFAIFNINYRLATGPVNLFPTQEQDIKSAIGFINAHRTEYAVSDKLALLGASAGGHLALLQAYKDTSAIKAKAVIDFFGPADMTAMYYDPALPGGDLAIAGVVGTFPFIDSVLYAQSSPINFVTSASSPTLLFHGGADFVVKQAQSDSLFSKLSAVNAKATYVIYPAQGHGWGGDTLTHSFDRIQAFLNTHMQ